MQNDLGTVLPLLAVAIFLCGVSAAAVDAIDDPAKGTFPHRLGVRDFDAHQRTSIEMTAKRTTATNDITDSVLACGASNVIFHFLYNKTPYHRATTRKSMHSVHKTTPTFDQATSSVLARRIAGELSDRAATAAPFFYSDEDACVSFIGHRLDLKTLFHGRRSATADSALPSHFRPPHRHSEAQSLSSSHLNAAADMQRTGPASPVTPAAATYLTLCVTIKYASTTVVLIAALSRPRTKSNLMIGQRNWKMRSSMISGPSPSSPPMHNIRPLAADVGYEFFLIRSSSAYNLTRSLMQPLFLHLAVTEVHQTWPIIAIACQTKSSHFSALPSDQFGTKVFMKDQVATQKRFFFRTLLSFLVESSVDGIRHAPFYLPAFTCTEHQLQNLALDGFIIFARCLVISALLGFCLAFYLHRQRSFTTFQHVVASSVTSASSFCRYMFQSPLISASRHMAQTSYCKRYIRNAHCVIHYSAGRSSVTPSSRETAGACASVYLIERIAAYLHIKSWTLLKFQASLGTTIMTLLLHLLLCPITNAQACEKLMLGMDRYVLASASLPTGLMIFAGGWTGADCSCVCLAVATSALCVVVVG
jgi:hypothetical protein